jgi:hypothetical protein
MTEAHSALENTIFKMWNKKDVELHNFSAPVHDVITFTHPETELIHTTCKRILILPCTKPGGLKIMLQTIFGESSCFESRSGHRLSCL